MTSCIYEFNALDADLALVSSPPDGTEFRVHKCILAAASPFFSDMLSLPQPPAIPSRAEGAHKLPIVPVSESSTTLERLLRFVYPIPDPVIDNLDDLSLVLGAAVKYDFAAVLSTLRRLLLTPCFVENAPTRVYAIACRYDLEAEAKHASRYTLSVNVLDCPLSEDLKHITAYSYHRLLDLHRRRAKAAQDLLQIPEQVKCMQCNGSAYGIPSPPKWWVEFECRAKAELALRPTSERIFEMGFLARAAQASGCHRCAGSVLDSFKFLEDLKKSIDVLPATI